MMEASTQNKYTNGNKGERRMKKSKIALKPYLDTITGYCNTLSNEELANMLICLAKDVPISGRVNFLEKIESYLPGRRPAIMPYAGPVEQILDDIEELKESIEERIRSIEDGSYWDEPDVWGDYGHPDLEGEEIQQPLEYAAWLTREKVHPIEAQQQKGQK
jgi:hypothetical protein